MELARRRVKAPADGRPLKIYPLGDIHLGAAACDVDHFRRTVALIARDPDAYWIGMGDYGDLILPSDPRWSWSGHDWKRIGFSRGRPNVANLAVEYRDMIGRMLDPIAGKCLAILFGNHEHTFSRHYFIDLAEFLADRFKVEMLGYTALLRLDIEITRGAKDHGRLWSPVIFAEHGANGGGTKGNAINAIEKRGNEFEADVYLKGHIHQYNTSRKDSLGWGANVQARKDRVFMLTGTYLKGYTEHETPYSEYKAYPPNEIGGGVVIFDPKNRRIHAVSVDALEVLSR